MLDRKQFGALLGFLFVAAWIAFNFGYAVLCLVGAGVFYFVASYLEGDVDMADLQSRFAAGGSALRPGSTQAAPPTGPPPAQTAGGRPPGAAPRVR